MDAVREQADRVPEQRKFAPVIRKILVCTGACGGLCALAGLFRWDGEGFLFWFGFAALLSGWNFWGIANFVHKKISGGWSKSLGIGLFLNSHIRLFITGLLVYTALVVWKAPPVALVGGLSVSLVFIVISVCCYKN